ncbi:hypothetical protein [Coleofasciculus sp.]|uniref:hypothetical protein n=1 Tax=Coleofasciculus sp. TaxID=3100458 RepID=UPI003A12C797
MILCLKSPTLLAATGSKLYRSKTIRSRLSNAATRRRAIGATNELAVQWNTTLWNQDNQKMQGQGVTIVHLQKGQLVLAHEFIFDLSPSFFQANQPAAH